MANKVNLILHSFTDPETTSYVAITNNTASLEVPKNAFRSQHITVKILTSVSPETLVLETIVIHTRTAR